MPCWPSGKRSIEGGVISTEHTEGADMTHTAALAPVLAEHITAVNAFDEDAIVGTFAEDALVNDAHREFRGTEAIRRWAARELVGDRVTIVVTEVLDHH